MGGAGRLLDYGQAQSDGHGCPACPHPMVTGPAILGSFDVNINGRPALRQDDIGIHAVCCAMNTWTATKGAPNVNINGKPAHRVMMPSSIAAGPGSSSWGARTSSSATAGAVAVAAAGVAAARARAAATRTAAEEAEARAEPVGTEAAAPRHSSRRSRRPAGSMRTPCTAKGPPHARRSRRHRRSRSIPSSRRPLVVVVRKQAKNPTTGKVEPYTHPKRQAMTLRTDSAFDGTATLSCDHPERVKFFSAAKGGQEIKLDGKDNVFKPGAQPKWAAGASLPSGVKVFAEGVAASGGMDDITVKLEKPKPRPQPEAAISPSFQVAANLVTAPGRIMWAQAETPSNDMRDTGRVLGIKDVDDEGDMVTVTAVKIRLDICKSRATAGALPDPLADDDKANVGRFVYEQDAAGHHGRALLVVRKVKPEKFKGALTLTGIGLAKVELMPNERPTGGETATALPTDIDYDPAVPAKKNQDRTFWVQGKTGGTSTAPRDVQLFLRLKDDPPANADVVSLTVFKLVKVAATLKPTPSKRAGAVSSNPTVDFVDDNKTFRATDLTLIKQCGDLDLTTSVLPAGVPLTWDVEQAPDDKVKKNPHHKANGADTGKRLLEADAEGSFHVLVFNDGNGSGKRDASESALVVNVDMVKIRVLTTAGSNRIFSGNFHAGTVSATNLNVNTFNAAHVGAGTNTVYGDGILALEAVGMRVAVELTAGGPDQRRGLTKVGMGFIQPFPSDNFLGTYPGGKTVREVFINKPSAFPAFTIVPPPPPPPPPPPMPTIATFPVRDHRSATGKGYDAVINSSSDADGKGTPFATGGERWVVRFLDSPSVVMPLTHPVTGTALASISGTNDFVDFLVSFSTDFNENFTVFADASWSVNFGTFAAGAWSAGGASVTTSGGSMSTAGYPKRGELTPMEHYQPGATEAWRLDAR